MDNEAIVSNLQIQAHFNEWEAKRPSFDVVKYEVRTLTLTL